MRRVGRTKTLSVAVLLAAACSGESPPVAEQEPVQDAGQAHEDDDNGTADEVDEAAAVDDEPDETVPDVGNDEPRDDEQMDAQQVARAYFEAFATQRPATMAEMVDLSADGSVAQRYAQVQIAQREATSQQGFTTEPARLTSTDTGFELCAQDGVGGQACSDFDDLTVADGLLVSFVIDNTDLTARLADMDSVAEDGRVTVTLIGAYHSVQADELTVVFDIVNDGDQTANIDLFSAEYVNADGRQISVLDYVGPTDLRAGASATAAVFFDAQSVGGVVYVGGAGEDFRDTYEWQINLGPPN